MGQPIKIGFLTGPSDLKGMALHPNFQGWRKQILKALILTWGDSAESTDIWELVLQLTDEELLQIVWPYIDNFEWDFSKAFLELFYDSGEYKNWEAV